MMKCPGTLVIMTALIGCSSAPLPLVVPEHPTSSHSSDQALHSPKASAQHNQERPRFADRVRLTRLDIDVIQNSILEILDTVQAAAHLKILVDQRERDQLIQSPKRDFRLHDVPVTTILTLLLEEHGLSYSLADEEFILIYYKRGGSGLTNVVYEVGDFVEWAGSTPCPGTCKLAGILGPRHFTGHHVLPTFIRESTSPGLLTEEGGIEWITDEKLAIYQPLSAHREVRDLLEKLRHVVHPKGDGFRPPRLGQ